MSDSRQPSTDDFEAFLGIFGHLARPRLAQAKAEGMTRDYPSRPWAAGETLARTGGDAGGPEAEGGAAQVQRPGGLGPFLAEFRSLAGPGPTPPPLANDASRTGGFLARLPLPGSAAWPGGGEGLQDIAGPGTEGGGRREGPVPLPEDLESFLGDFRHLSDPGPTRSSLAPDAMRAEEFLASLRRLLPSPGQEAGAGGQRTAAARDGIPPPDDFETFFQALRGLSVPLQPRPSAVQVASPGDDGW
ncbi:MAG: hypothetical protein LBP92_00160 [Deltaproteobacteria bacterium]|nr:hypothetical protein [Deltaproteobacteria bacterium]